MHLFSKHLQALIACIIAATLWGLFWYPLRLLEDLGVSGLWSTLAIYLFAISGVIPFTLKSLRQSQSWNSLILLGLFSGWTNLAFILAMLEGTVVRGLLLFYLSPIWTILLGRLILKEPVKPLDYLNVLLGLSGAVIMLWSSEFKALFSQSADWYALSAGFAFALNNIYVRKTAGVPIVIKMFFAWNGVLFLAILGILVGQGGQFEFSYQAMLVAALIGILGMTAMTSFAQYGVTHLPVNQSAILFLFEVPVGAVSAALWAGESILLSEYMGGSLILVAAFLTAQSALKESSTD